MRTHIAKSLQARCKAIKSAVKAYNQAALALSPPRPTIDWSVASHYTFLDDFAFLQDTQDELRQKAWSQPLAREILKKARRVERAKEEIERCNIEARRLYTSILDEHEVFATLLVRLREQHSLLYAVAVEFCDRRRSINLRHLQRLELLTKLEGFTGNLTRGVRVGRPEALGVVVEEPVVLDPRTLYTIDAAAEDELFDEQEDVEVEVGGVVEYVSNLV